MNEKSIDSLIEYVLSNMGAFSKDAITFYWDDRLDCHWTTGRCKNCILSDDFGCLLAKLNETIKERYEELII